MKRIAFIAFALSALFLLVPIVRCQGKATITGTITDSDATAWASATWTATANNPSGGTMINKLTGAVVPNSVVGTLTTAGAFTGSNQITRTDDIIPAGVTWVFTICSFTSAPCVALPRITIAASSVNLGTLFSPITSPRFPITAVGYGYTTGEVTTRNVGSTIYLYAPLSTPPLSCHVWNGIAFQDCAGSTATASTVFITDPPYNAKCDATTDDSAAIQAALNSGSAIVMFPVSTSTTQYQCNIASTLTWPVSQTTLEMNGSILDYTGTSIGIDLTNSNAVIAAIIQDGLLELDAVTGSATMLGTASPSTPVNVILSNLVFNSVGDTTESSITINNATYLYGINLQLLGENVLTGFVNLHNTGIMCTANAQNGIDVKMTSELQTYENSGASDCQSAINIIDNGINTEIFNFDGFIGSENTTSVINLPTNIYATINGRVEYSSNDSPLFTNASYFNGSLIAYDDAVGRTTQYNTTTEKTQFVGIVESANGYTDDTLSIDVGNCMEVGTAGLYTQTGSPCYNPASTTVTLGACGSGSPTVSGPASGFSISVADPTATSCAVTFSPALTNGVCIANTNSPNVGASIYLTALSTTGATWDMVPNTSLITAVCN